MNRENPTITIMKPELATPEQAAPKAFWHELLACPGCRTPLPDWSRCASCGRTFEAEDGAPRLMAPDLERVFEYRFVASRSSPGKPFLDRVLRDPPTDHGLGALPYHFDPAQAVVLSRLPRGSRVLEVGCGGGQARTAIEGLGHEYVGTDLSRTRVHDWLQKHGGADILCDSHFLPFQDERFDAVYSAAVTEHLACPALALREIFRVLKPGGYYLGNCSFLEPWHDQSFFHVSPLGAGELLTQAGFEIEAIWPGRRYDTFKAVAVMMFRGPFRALVPLARLQHLAYCAQNRLLALARRATKRSPVRPIIEAATVAGATDWIARRPAAANLNRGAIE